MKVAGFILFIFLFIASFSQNADINLLHTINKNESPFADKSFKAVTHSMIPVSIAAPVTLFTVSLFSSDSAMKRNSYKIAVSIGISSLLSTGLKYSIQRKRPFETYSFIKKKVNAGDPSFPSGHATAAFATAASLSLSYPKWYVIAPSFLWAGSVVYSRVYLGVHYPSDVLGGIVLGVGTSLLVWQAEKWINKK